MSKRPQQDQLGKSGKNRVYMGNQSVQAQPPSAPASAPAPAPAPSPPTHPIHRGRSGLHRLLNPIEELYLYPDEREILAQSTPQQQLLMADRIDVRQQGGASTQMVTARQNVGRNAFQNLAGDADYARVRAARAGVAGSPSMRALPTSLQQTPSPDELARRQTPQSTASSASYASNASSMSGLVGAFGEQLDLEDEDMNGKGFKKLKKGSPAMKAHMAKLRAMRKKK